MNELQPGFGQLVQNSLDKLIDALVDEDGDIRAVQHVEWIDKSRQPGGPFLPKFKLYLGTYRAFLESAVAALPAGST